MGRKGEAVQNTSGRETLVGLSCPWAWRGRIGGGSHVFIYLFIYFTLDNSVYRFNKKKISCRVAGIVAVYLLPHFTEWHFFLNSLRSLFKVSLSQDF